MAMSCSIHKLYRSDWVLRAPTAAQQPRCTLMDVSIAYGSDSDAYETICRTIPCFSCSGFIRFEDYYTYAKAWLASAIIYRYFPQVRKRRATRVVEDLILTTLGDGHFHCGGPFPVVYAVYINFWPHVSAVEIDVDRAIRESLEEAEPRAKPATLESRIGLYMVRCGQESKELERSWSESEHECMICMDEIEKHCESLTMPCSHVFHESCLNKWLDNNYVCPLYRYEMPYDDLMDSIS